LRHYVSVVLECAQPDVAGKAQDATDACTTGALAGAAPVVVVNAPALPAGFLRRTDRAAALLGKHSQQVWIANAVLEPQVAIFL
jgi:hypothetical protein